MAEKRFPPLHAKASNGKTKWWMIAVRTGPLGPRKDWGQILVWYGYIGQDEDKIQLATRWIENGKNIGKKNETTAYEQACLEAEAMWNKKKDKKYVEDSSGESDALLPMLALDYKKRGHNIEWPAYVQPKLNGVRCLARRAGKEEIVYHSRGGKTFETLGHLDDLLLSFLKEGEVLDGEIFTPELSFQEICSAVKGVKTQKQDPTQLQYWIYDMVLPGVPFEERWITICQRANACLSWPSKNYSSPIVPVLSVESPDEKDMFRLHSLHVLEGYEGTIIRNKSGLYRCDFRSADLQKYKDFLDGEFVIIGGKDGDGKFVGSITWVCITEAGEEFDVVPKGTMDQRRQWYKDREQYFGRKITVKYQNLSDDRKVPVFPVGLAIRDYE